jgi:transglutaminase-like putative cysteine protease
VCALPVVVSAFVYAGFFATPAFLLVVIGAAITAAPVAAAVALRQYRADSTLAIGVLAGFAYLSYTLFRPNLDYGLPGPRTATAVVSAVAHGWGRMLSVALPADVRVDFLALPTAVAWTASFAAITIALRTRWVLGRLAPGFAAFTLAVLCAGSRPTTQLAPGIGFLAACAAVLACAGRPVGTGPQPTDRRQPGARARATGDRTAPNAGGAPPSQRRMPVRGSAVRSVAVAACGTAAILAASVVGTEAFPNAAHRFDPRTLDPPVVAVNEAVTPLAAVRSQLQEHPARLVTTVTLAGPGAAAVSRIRTAALDDYDGSAWTASDRFLLAGQVLSGNAQLRQAQLVTANISLAAGAGPYLPEVGQPVGLSWQNPAAQLQVGFDQNSGILVARGLSAADATYTLHAQVTPVEGLDKAEPAADPANTALPVPAPGILTQIAWKITASKATPYAKLRALAAYLRSLPYNLHAPPGHSYGALTQMLAGTQPGHADGYCEQHAAAFAVLARILGFPARVATGYLLTGGRGGVYRVTTADADAWAEVHFNGYGWVAFDPTNTANTAAKSQTLRNPPPVPLASTQPPQAITSPGVTAKANAHGAPGNGWAAVVLADGLLGLAALAALCAVGCAAIAAEKGRRHLRRRWASDPAARLLGAWQSARDRLVEGGLDLPPSMAAQDVVASAARRFGRAANPVGTLVPLVATAVFTPVETAPAVADRAWHLYRQLLRGLYPHRFTLRRAAALVSPRALLAQHRQMREARAIPPPPRRGQGRRR